MVNNLAAESSGSGRPRRPSKRRRISESHSPTSNAGLPSNNSSQHATDLPPSSNSGRASSPSTTLSPRSLLAQDRVSGVEVLKDYLNAMEEYYKLEDADEIDEEITGAVFRALKCAEYKKKYFDTRDELLKLKSVVVKSYSDAVVVSVLKKAISSWDLHEIVIEIEDGHREDEVVAMIGELKSAFHC